MHRRHMKPKVYLTIAEIKGFQEIFRMVFGKSLTFQEAEDQGIRLVRLFELIIEQKKNNNRGEAV